ncbi:hypothetical protein FB451DRAFT_1400895 [Mycena latifolia]|nr:hypothetical protein FB451DRAFT_1400895 [Mycena latifolia]
MRLCVAKPAGWTQLAQARTTTVAGEGAREALPPSTRTTVARTPSPAKRHRPSRVATSVPACGTQGHKARASQAIERLGLCAQDASPRVILGHSCSLARPHEMRPTIATPAPSIGRPWGRGVQQRREGVVQAPCLKAAQEARFKGFAWARQAPSLFVRAGGRSACEAEKRAARTLGAAQLGADGLHVTASSPSLTAHTALTSLAAVSLRGLVAHWDAPALVLLSAPPRAPRALPAAPHTSSSPLQVRMCAVRRHADAEPTSHHRSMPRAGGAPAPASNARRRTSPLVAHIYALFRSFATVSLINSELLIRSGRESLRRQWSNGALLFALAGLAYLQACGQRKRGAGRCLARVEVTYLSLTKRQQLPQLLWPSQPHPHLVQACLGPPKAPAPLRICVARHRTSIARLASLLDAARRMRHAVHQRPRTARAANVPPSSPASAPAPQALRALCTPCPH